MKPLPFIEAIQFAKARGVTLPDTYYGELIGSARSRAWTIAGLTSATQLQGVLDSLNDALAKGDSFGAWKKAVRAGDVPLDLPAHRLDLVFRNHVQTAFNRGRCEQAARLTDSRPFLLYDAINDSRTRPAHAAMDGMVAARKDPIWETWMPMNGHNCRCRVISLTEAQARRMQEADAKRQQKNPEAMRRRAAATLTGPDAGWDYNVCDDVEAGLQRGAQALRKIIHERVVSRYDELVAAKAKRRLDLDEMTELGAEEMTDAKTETRDQFDRWLRKKMRKRGVARGVSPDYNTEVKDFLGWPNNKTTRDLVRDVVDNVMTRYPLTWVRKSSDAIKANPSAPPLTFQLNGSRGYYSHQNSLVVGDSRQTMVHEFAHRLQFTMPDLDDYFQELHVRRTAGDKQRLLRDITGNPVYALDEITREDKYYTPYAGREYVDAQGKPSFGRAGALEVMTTAFEAVLGDNDSMFELIRDRDPEMLRLVIGLLLHYNP